MAGKNQHYIPQFLQRGFSCQAAQGFALSSKKDKENAQVWIFERENVKQGHIRKKGAEKFFYGPESSPVDITITNAKYSYSKVVNNLRSHLKDTLIEEESIPGLIAHMFVRSDNIRQTAIGLGEVSLEVVNKSTEDIEVMTETFFRRLQEDPDKFTSNLSHEQRQVFRETIKRRPEFIRGLIRDKNISEKIASQLKNAISSLGKDMKEIAKNAHIDVLSDSIEPQKRVEMFEGLHWRISVKRAGSYILGDALVICQKTTGEYGSILLTDEDFQNVFLPISSQHLLIGMKDPRALNPDTESINNASARMSNKFFIASQNTKREILYQKKLGEHNIEFLNKQNVEITAIADQHWTN